MSLPGRQIYIFLTLIFLFLVPSRGMKCYFLTSRKLYHMKFAIFDVLRCRMSATSLTFLLFVNILFVTFPTGTENTTMKKYDLMNTINTRGTFLW